MVLEELKQSDAILLDNLLHFLHEGVVLLHSVEICESINESGLGASGWSIDHVLEAVSVSQEVGVPDVVVLVAVDLGDSGSLLLTDLEAESIEHLSKDFGGDFEAAKGISVLEEALGIKSVFSDNLPKVVNNLLAQRSLVIVSLWSSIDSFSADLAHRLVSIPLQTLLSEDFVHSVREFSPLNVSALLRSLESCGQHFKLALRDGHLGHGETDSELGSSDVTRAQSVKVSEELRNADSLLFALLADAGNDIVNIVWSVPDDLSIACARLRLREVVKAVVEALTNTKELLTTIDVFAEVDIVDFVDVTFVHVPAEKLLDHLRRCRDSEQVEDAEELVLGHVTVLRDIVVLEHWF